MTAEEIIEKMDDEIPYHVPIYIRDYIKEAILIHTKYHVEQALKAASEKAKVFIYENNATIDKDSILNAYSIENIK